MTIEQLAGGSMMVGEFLRHMRDVRVRSANTINSYGGDLKHFGRYLRGEIGHRAAAQADIDVLLAGVEKRDVRDYLAYLAYLAVQRYGGCTVARKLSMLRSFYRWATAARRVWADPAAGVRWRGMWHREACVALSDADLNYLFLAAQSESFVDMRSRAVMEIVLATGLNRRELAGLAWADVADGGQAVRVRRRAGVRELPIGECAALWLRAFMLLREPGRSLDQSPWLWVSCDGARLHPKTLNRSLGLLAARAGVRSPVNIRSLRNTHVARRLAAGETAGRISTDLGLINGAATVARQHRVKRSSAA